MPGGRAICRTGQPKEDGDVRCGPACRNAASRRVPRGKPVLVALAIVTLVGGQGLLERVLPEGTVEYVVGGVAGACVSLMAIAGYAVLDTARLNRELRAERARRKTERVHPA